MDPSQMQFIEPMELTGSDINRSIITSTSKTSPIVKNEPHAFRPRRLCLQHCLDRLFNSLSNVATPLSDEAHTLTLKWNNCACAAAYLETLQQVIPLLQCHHLEQQLFTRNLQKEIEIAETQSQRHFIFIDQETARGNLTIEDRKRYQRDAHMYNKAKAQIELHLQHQHNIVDTRRQITALAHELEHLLEEAKILEEKVEREPECNSAYSPVGCDSQQAQIIMRMPKVQVDHMQYVLFSDKGNMETLIDEIELRGLAVGRIICSLLDTEVREHLQIELKLEGWREH